MLIYPRRTLNGVEGDHFLVCPPLTIDAGDIDVLLARLERTCERMAREVINPLRNQIPPWRGTADWARTVKSIPTSLP